MRSSAMNGHSPPSSRITAEFGGDSAATRSGSVALALGGLREPSDLQRSAGLGRGEEGEEPTLAGLYVHIPFCSSICPYCDYYVLIGDAEHQRRFVDLVIAEIGLWRGFENTFDTLYFGGGTPSAIAATELERILATLRRELDISPEATIFLEANPEDLDPSAVAAWRDLGVGTLSLGVQAFDDGALRSLGRRHDRCAALRSVAVALEAGFETVSLDLIYGLPGQTLEQWRAQLVTAVALAPQHLSCYQLTYHTGTPFGFRLRRGEMRQLSEDTLASMFFLTHELLAEAGYPAYEVSNFAASPRHRSSHNRKYWTHAPYLGLGPSAHSFSGTTRWWNVRKIKPWQQHLVAGCRPVENSEDLSVEQLALEEVMLGFRTSDGLDAARLRQRWGVELLVANAGTVDRLCRQGLLRLEGERLIPTLAGLAVADSLAAAFEI